MLDPLPETIPHLVAEAARLRGGATALIEDDESWTNLDLWQDCRRAASAMIESGLDKGDRVAIWAPNSYRWIVAAVAAMTCGAAIVPLNTRLRGQEAADILRRTNTSLLVTVGSFLGTDYPALLSEQSLPPGMRTVVLEQHWNDFLGEGQGADDARVDAALGRLGADDVSDILFTSGTTGSPKGAIATHSRTIPMFAEWTRLMGIEEGEKYLIINPFFHSFGYKAGWVAALIAGAVILPVAQFDISRVIELIEKQGVNFLPGPPTIYQSLLAAKDQQEFDVSSLRGAATGAASVPAELIRRMQGELGLVDTVTAYGMTECPCITSCRRGDPPELIARSCGKAIPGLELKVCDNTGHAMPAGEPGEICVRGYGVMLGYLDDPQGTAEAIDSDGWLHTGDVGVLDDEGYLRITDRIKDMYISGGFNVYPAEVENLLAGHPAISMSAVIGVPDDRMGEVGKAFVVLREGRDCDAETLAVWCKDKMANYKIPRAFCFVDDLPKNASGKILKNELRSA